MGQTSSRSLKDLFHPVLRETSKLALAFNAVLVLDGIRPSFIVKPEDLGEDWDSISSTSSLTKKAVTSILLHSKKKLVSSLMSENGYRISLAKPNSKDVKWATCPVPSHSTDETFVFKGFVFYKGQSGLFFEEACALPLSSSTVKEMYDSFVHVYRVARSVDEQLDVKLTHHTELSSDSLSSVMSLKTHLTPKQIQTLIKHLRVNGFSDLAERLEKNPKEINVPSFRSKVLVPIHTFISSGMSDVMAVGPSQDKELEREKAKWTLLLLSTYSSSRK